MPIEYKIYDKPSDLVVELSRTAVKALCPNLDFKATGLAQTQLEILFHRIILDSNFQFTRVQTKFPEA